MFKIHTSFERPEIITFWLENLKYRPKIDIAFMIDTHFKNSGFPESMGTDTIQGTS